MFLHILLLVFSLNITDVFGLSKNNQSSDKDSLCQSVLTGNSEAIGSEVVFDKSRFNQRSTATNVKAIVDEFHLIRNSLMSPNRYSNREKALAVELVKVLDGNVSVAAKELKMPYTTLHRWVHIYEDIHDIQIINSKVYPVHALDAEFLRAVGLVIEYGGNISRAAKELEMSTTTLHRWVHIYEDIHDIQIINSKVYPVHALDAEFLRAVGLVIEYGGNISRAAKELEMSTTTLHRWVHIYKEKHGIQNGNSTSSEEASQQRGSL